MTISVNVPNRALALLQRLCARDGVSLDEYCRRIFFALEGCYNPKAGQSDVRVACVPPGQVAIRSKAQFKFRSGGSRAGKAGTAAARSADAQNP